MRPVDTAAGSLSDPNRLLQVDLDKWMSVNLDGQPAEVAYNRINALTGIEFGFAPGVDKQAPVKVSMAGAVRDVLTAVGNSAGVRFEVGGPTQIRVMEARKAAPRKTVPPPVRRK